MSWRAKIADTMYRAFVKFMKNATSKKFLVFIAATALLVEEFLTPEIWLPVALGVLGVQGVLDYKSEDTSFRSEKLPKTNISGIP